MYKRLNPVIINQIFKFIHCKVQKAFHSWEKKLTKIIAPKAQPLYKK